MYQGALARPKPFPRCQSEYSDSIVRAIVVMLVVIVVVVVVVLFILFSLMRRSRLQIYLVVLFAIYDFLQLNKMKFKYFSFQQELSL